MNTNQPADELFEGVTVPVGPRPRCRRGEVGEMMTARLFEVTDTARHPCPYPAAVLDTFAGLLDNQTRLKVLDPFAGTGRIHRLPHDTTGIEIEALWAAWHPDTLVGDATKLPFLDESFDAVVTSPTYGNRMADLYSGDGSTRRTYRTALGRDLHVGNSGGMQWGCRYRELHEAAWFEAWRVLRPGGLILVNVKDHVRQGRRVHVVDWHTETLRQTGFTITGTTIVDLNGWRFGANADRRIGHEVIISGRKT